MSGNTLANGDLNAFSVQPSGEKLITVPASRLESLQDQIDALQDRIIKQDEKLAALEATQDLHAENQFIQLRLIKDLQRKEPRPTETNRAEKIASYLKARADHKASFESLRGHLGIDKARLNEAIKILLPTGRYRIVLGTDKRKRVLVLRPGIGPK